MRTRASGARRLTCRAALAPLPPAARLQVLRLNGVPVYRTEHRAGSYVVTLPRAYHCGFNAGFNLSESCNFALPPWLPVGAAALRRYRTVPRRDSTLLHEALVVTAAAREACPTARAALSTELRRLLDEESRLRAALLTSGVAGASAAEQTSLDVAALARAAPWEDGTAEAAEAWRCRECRHFSYFSTVLCACDPAAGRAHLCLRHALARDEPSACAPRLATRIKGGSRRAKYGAPAAGAPALGRMAGGPAAAAAAEPGCSALTAPCACTPAQRTLIVRYARAQIRHLLGGLAPPPPPAEPGAADD